MCGVQTARETRKSWGPADVPDVIPMLTDPRRPKKDKYPYGYPGDEFGVKSIAHHKCHECNAKFPPGVENGTPCSTCSHEKCDNCERLRPQKIEPEPDPDAWKRVQDKFVTLSIT